MQDVSSWVALGRENENGTSTNDVMIVQLLDFNHHIYFCIATFFLRNCVNITPAVCGSKLEPFDPVLRTKSKEKKQDSLRNRNRSPAKITKVILTAAFFMSLHHYSTSDRMLLYYLHVLKLSWHDISIINRYSLEHRCNRYPLEQIPRGKRGGCITITLSPLTPNWSSSANHSLINNNSLSSLRLLHAGLCNPNQLMAD